MSFEKKVTRRSNGKDRTGEPVGKPKAGDVVRVTYRAWILKKNAPNGKLERDGSFLSTHLIGNAVAFKVLGDNGAEKHDGLYAGLDEAVRTMELGEVADVTLPPGLAFGDRGLHQHPNTGVAKTLQLSGNRMENDPKAPADHQNRNPLCVSYLPVQPGTPVLLEGLTLTEVNGKRAPARWMGICKCLALCWNAFQEDPQASGTVYRAVS